MFTTHSVDLRNEKRLSNCNFSHLIKNVPPKCVARVTCLCLQGTAVEAAVVQDAICRFKNIEQLELGELQVSESVIHCASGNLKKLKDLRLIKTEYINLHTIKIIARYLPNLECLHLPFSANVDDRVLKIIATRIRGLKRFSMRGCKHVTDEGLRLMLKCSGLQYIDVSYTKTMSYPTCVCIGQKDIFINKIMAPNTNLMESGLKLLKLRFEDRGLDPANCIVFQKQLLPYPGRRKLDFSMVFRRRATAFKENSGNDKV